MPTELEGAAEPHETSPRLGLALSGGGSRAAAFHRGALRGLIKLGLVPQVKVVSTVSGGSLFGGAWMASRARGDSDEVFLQNMGAQLQKGFLLRAVGSLNALKVLLPGFNRTDRMAEVFDDLFCRDRSGRSLTLTDLPEHPKLCINTTVVNHGQVGKFSREGLWAPQVQPIGWKPLPDKKKSIPPIPLNAFKLSRAVAASAAFPIGLPPLVLSRKGELANAEFTEALASHKALTLTDGGVLENLGIQTLLRSGPFAAWNLIISDAGVREDTWEKGMFSTAVDMFLPIISGGILKQLLVVMNNKQNRWMRFNSILELEESWLKDELRGRARAGEHPELSEAAKWFITRKPLYPRRQIWFLRINQNLDKLLEGVPGWRLVELWARGKPGTPIPKLPESAAERLAFLSDCGVDLSEARKEYDEMGGIQRAEELNQVVTSWTGLSTRDVTGLEQHGLWQMLAAHAIYGPQQ